MRFGGEGQNFSKNENDDIFQRRQSSANVQATGYVAGTIALNQRVVTVGRPLTPGNAPRWVAPWPVPFSISLAGVAGRQANGDACHCILFLQKSSGTTEFTFPVKASHRISPECFAHVCITFNANPRCINHPLTRWRSIRRGSRGACGLEENRLAPIVPSTTEPPQKQPTTP